jgi:predicted acylesterase/phospholipase RssA
MGCLRALEDLLDRSMLDLDFYVGVSGGAFVAALLAQGVSPAEMYAEALGGTRKPLGIGTTPLFRLSPREFLKRTAKAPAVLREAVATAFSGNGHNLSDLAFSLFEVLPPGLLDNSGIEEFLAALFKSRRLKNRFDGLRRRLYIVAVDLDSGDHVAFGERGQKDVTISKAVQASTALPGLYRPVRIAGRDFVDGGVKKTAHINLAIHHGADLVICINPLVPILNDTGTSPIGHLSDKGLAYVLDQVLRIMVYGRVQYGLERYRTEHPEVDVLLLEPNRENLRMFAYNIMRLGAREVVAREGYLSVVAEFRRHKSRYEALLARHGIALRDPSSLAEPGSFRAPAAQSLAETLDRLERTLPKTRRRRA